MNLRPAHPVGLPLDAVAELVSPGAAAAARRDVTVTGVTLRGQDARPGDLFAALPGARSHGAVFAAEAVAYYDDLVAALETDQDGPHGYAKRDLLRVVVDDE